MGRTKLVNGVRHPLTPEEEMACDADEAKEAARDRTHPPTEMEVLSSVLIDKGVIAKADLDRARKRLRK